MILAMDAIDTSVAGWLPTSVEAVVSSRSGVEQAEVSIAVGCLSKSVPDGAAGREGEMM